MTDFETWLESRFIDVQALEPELRSALVAQYEAELRAAEPPKTVLLILDGSDDDQWQRAIWLPK